jgi:predicted GNAT family acetyltransferase
VLGEIAVGVEEGYRRQGFGKAVVAHAVARVLAAGKVPVYVPDELTNAASNAQARSLGFAKLGETLYWEEELPDWHGFPLGPTGK